MRPGQVVIRLEAPKHCISVEQQHDLEAIYLPVKESAADVENTFEDGSGQVDSWETQPVAMVAAADA